MGKSALAIDLAGRFDTDIINADSRQVYKEMCIGTARPSPAQMAVVRHHLAGVRSVRDRYNASLFETEVLELLSLLYTRKDAVIMAGGSGLYIDAVCGGIDEFPPVDRRVREKLREIHRERGLEAIKLMLLQADPEYYHKTDLNNPMRILKALEITEMTGRPYSSFLTGEKKTRNFTAIKVGVDLERSQLYDNINRRVDLMMESGLLEEAASLMPYKGLNALNTFGYKEIFLYLEGRISLDEAVDLIKRHTRQYARRQLTWFRRDKGVRWFHPGEADEIYEYVLNKIEQHELAGD